MKLLSVILPAYNEEKMIETIEYEISQILEEAQIQYEIIFVDDGSKDDTFRKIVGLAEARNNIRGISFSRNFGKEAAIFAGLEAANGDCCVVMDCDLQHPPSIIPKMYALWEKGYQIVEGVKKSRGKETFAYRFASSAFYGLMKRLSGVDMKNASDFKLLDSRVVKILVSLPEKHVFFRGLSNWVGYRSTTIEYTVSPRRNGEAKWSYSQLIKYAINNITSFSSSLLQVITITGAVFIMASLVLGVQTLFNFFSGRALGGFTTIILLLLITGGMIMISLGIIGHYISKIYDEAKNRPKYIIMQEVSSDGFTKKDH